MLLHYIYKIISLELKGVNKEFILQIAVKAINNFASLNRLIPILLIFSAYPQIINNSLLSPSIV
jgi:hypothetical protein